MLKKNDLLNIRKNILNSINHADSGHLGPSYSCVEMIYVILKKYVNLKNKFRNKFILSKGHAAPAFYAVLDHLKLLKKNELNTLRKFKSRLQGHPDKKKLPYVDSGTGALGQGLSISIGYALSANLKNRENYVFCILGDGELQEGQTWEAAMYIGVKKLKNVITLIDANKFQNEYSVKDTLEEINIKKKWEAFGFNFFKINGHSLKDIDNTINKCMNKKINKPCVIYCDTIKGKGVSIFENNNKYHSIKKLSTEEYEIAIRELSIK